MANLTAELATNTLASGEYTTLILPDTNNAPPSGSPGGGGYAVIANFAPHNPALARATITGALADGTAFNRSVPVSQNGYVPLYASLYGGKGLLQGWINLESANAYGVGLTWIHPTQASGLYRKGFTNVLSGDQLPLSPWSNSPANLRWLTNLSTLSTADVINTPHDLSIAVTVNANGKVSGSLVSGGIINHKTGLWRATIGGGANKIVGHGALLLNSASGGGYFLTKTNAQAIELEP